MKPGRAVAMKLVDGRVRMYMIWAFPGWIGYRAAGYRGPVDRAGLDRDR